MKTYHSEVNKATTNHGKAERKTNANTGQRCWRCEGQHSPKTCKFSTATCHYCHKRSHLEKACISKKKATKKGYQRSITADTSQEQQSTIVEHQVSSLHALASGNTAPKITVSISLNSTPVIFEVDSGAACTMISRGTFCAVWPTKAPQVCKEDIHPRTCSGQVLEVLGTATVLSSTSTNRASCRCLWLKDQVAAYLDAIGFRL
ncbi:uncharacterized protein LOC135389262 [Ornithodoros turicata]|uniref:uncharacterized protein LOC135389262 n=1 Tax=Ornithodoros turicata TaxID=34597 RepID=UPI003139F705